VCRERDPLKERPRPPIHLVLRRRRQPRKPLPSRRMMNAPMPLSKSASRPHVIRSLSGFATTFRSKALTRWSRPRCRCFTYSIQHGHRPFGSQTDSRGFPFEVSAARRYFPTTKANQTWLESTGLRVMSLLPSAGRRMAIQASRNGIAVAGVAATPWPCGDQGEAPVLPWCGIPGRWPARPPHAVPTPEWAVLWFFLHAGVAHDGTV